MTRRPPEWVWGEIVPAPAPQRPARRAVYGRIYELITGDPQDGPHPYVGQTVQTIHQRVHGPGGHTSPASVAKDPWKARVLPGRAGYRLLETVYDTGDPGENQRALDRAEDFWIDRLRTTHNDVRPVRPPVHEPQPPRRPRTTQTARPTPARRRRRRRVPVRWVLLLLTVAAGMALIAWPMLATDRPWSTVLTAAGLFGAPLGAFCWLRVYHAGRKAKLWK